MLLTVIAVATLLVAVVGATFAYFSLSVSGQSGSTANGTVTTSKVGSIAFSTDTTDLTLTVSGEDMLPPGAADKTFYAVKGSTDTGTHGNENPIEIAKVTLSGAKAGDTYTCSGNTLTVTPDGSMLEGLAKHTDKTWVQLAIAGTMGASQTINFTTAQAKQAIDVDVPEITFAADGEKNITAVLSLVNSKDDDQQDIADSTLNVTVKFTPGSCSMTSKAS